MKSFQILGLSFMMILATQAQEWVSYQSQQKINDLVDTGTELILATDHGLVVINKNTLKKSIFTKANSNLNFNHIQSVAQAPNGDIWIGTYDVKISRFDGANFQDLETPPNTANPNSHLLYDLEIAPNGEFWMGTNEGVLRKQNQMWSYFDQTSLGANFFEAWDIAINDAGDVYVGSNSVFKFSNGAWSDISDTTQLIGYLDAELFFTDNGDLFFAGDLNRIGVFNGSTWQILDLPTGFNGFEVDGFVQKTNGDILFYSLYDGMYQLIGNQWVPQSNAQASVFLNRTTYYYIDDNDIPWYNSSIHLSVERNGGLENVLISDHTIENNGVSDVVKGMNGSMYFVTSSAQYFSVLSPNGDWSLLPLPNTLTQFEMIRDMFILSDNDIWVSTNIGLHHFDGTSWTLNALGSCRDFAMDNQGKLYIAGETEIYYLENGVFEQYNSSNSPLNVTLISGIGLDQNDNLWVAALYEDIIYKRDASGVWETFNAIDHPAIEGPKGSFHFDQDGNVWVPAEIVGAIKYDGTSFSNPINDDLSNVPNYTVHDIQIDASGTLYFSHYAGVTTLLNGEWGDLTIDELPISISSNATIAFDDDGSLWWASQRYGVFAYKEDSPNAVRENLGVASDFSLFPNPAKGFTNINFSLTETTPTQIRVINLQGQLVQHYELGELEAGIHHKFISLDNLPSGIYLIELRANKHSLVNKLSVQ